MLCPETCSESRENICSSYPLIFLQYIYWCHAVHVQNDPKNEYIPTISNQQPVTYGLNQIQSRLPWPHSPAPAPPAAPVGLRWLGVAAMGSCPLEKGETPASCLPFIPHVVVGTQEMEEETPMLVGGKQNTDAAQKCLIVFTAPTHSVIPRLGRTLPAPCTLLDGPLCLLGQVPARGGV